MGTGVLGTAGAGELGDIGAWRHQGLHVEEGWLLLSASGRDLVLGLMSMSEEMQDGDVAGMGDMKQRVFRVMPPQRL